MSRDGSTLGSKVIALMGYESPSYKWFVFLGVISPTDPITFDANFQQDILVGFEGSCFTLEFVETPSKMLANLLDDDFYPY